MGTLSRARSGGPVPSSRGKRRGPRDLRKRLEADEEDFGLAIGRWLGREGRRERLQSLNLRAFLQQCPHPSWGPGERLRRLGIYLDDRVDTWRESPLAEWTVFSRIYDAAARLEADNANIYHARAVTALNLAWWRDADDPAAPGLMKEARASAARGLALAGDDADMHFLVGHVAYMDRSSATEEALAACSRALELQPEHAMARLYRAHCLHDLERWAEAADAYAEATLASFSRSNRWRKALAREQRAYCMWRGGEVDQARVVFEELLRHRKAVVARCNEEELAERAHPVLREPPIYFAEAVVSGEFGSELAEGLRQHLETLDQLWVLERA